MCWIRILISFDPKAYSLLREDQRGKYYGVGMTVGPAQQQSDRDRAVCGNPSLSRRNPAG